VFHAVGRAQTLAAACTIAAVLTGCSAKTSGDSAPDFTLARVRGGSFHLRAHHRRPVLLAFLQTIPDTVDSPSRSEVVSVMSMATQFGPRGLIIAVIDSSALVNHARPNHNELINASYDWQLSVPLLEDANISVTQSFGVTQLPTLVLVARGGRIARRWEGSTKPAELALEIQNIVMVHSAGSATQPRQSWISGFRSRRPRSPRRETRFGRALSSPG
jgi:peroxiredoxin